MKKKKVVPAKVKKVHKDIDKKQKKKKVKPDPKPKPKYVVLLKNPGIAKVLHALSSGYVIRRRLLEGDFEYISLGNQFLSCESPVNGSIKWDIHTIDFSMSDYWEVLFPIDPTGVKLV